MLFLVYGLLGPVAAFAKMGTVPLIIFALFAHPSAHTAIAQFKRLLIKPLGLAILGLLFWCALTMIWAEQAAPLSLIRLTGVIALALLLPSLVAALDERKRKVLANIVIGSFVFVLVVLLIEGQTGAWLHRQLRPEDAIPREGEWVPYLEMVAARGTAMLAPFSFLVAVLIASKTQQKILGAGFIALSCAAAYMLPMEASAIAVVVGAVVYGLALWQPRLTLNIVFIGCTAALILSPFIVSSALNRANLDSVDIEISRNEAQRLAIWEFTSDEIFRRPVLGHGFDSSRVIGARDNQVDGTNWQALPLHPHNAFLQIWLELGFIGVALTCAVLWSLWREIRAQALCSEETAVYMATFCAVLTIALISFGVWQYWWIALWGLLGGALALLPNQIQRS